MAVSTFKLRRFYWLETNGTKHGVPRPFENELEKDMVVLFNYHAVMELLENWKNKIYLHQLNSDTLLNWCNNLAGAYTGLYFNNADWSVSREELGFNWQIMSTKQ
jgi:hypothetical protein